MATLEERVAYLEGRVMEQGQLFALVRELKGDLTDRMGELKGDLTAQMGELKTDLMAQMGELKTDLTAQMGELKADLAIRIDRAERRMDGFDAKLDQRFAWLVGLQVTTLIAMVAAILAR